MRRTVVALLSFVLSASIVSANGVGHTSTATVTPAASPAEQLARASQLWQQLQQAPPSQKPDLFAQVWANLALVRKAWPNDRSAVVRSGIMQADLATEFGVWPKAVQVLLDVLPAAAHTDAEPQVEQKLGQAYEQTGNTAAAETHLLAAERAMHATHQNRVESEKILRSLGLFYARQNRPVAAIQRFHEAQNLPGQDLVNQLSLQLSVIEQAARLGKDAAAPEVARFDDLVLAARRTNLSPADATLVSHMVQHAQRVRDGLH